MRIEVEPTILEAWTTKIESRNGYCDACRFYAEPIDKNSPFSAACCGPITEHYPSPMSIGGIGTDQPCKAWEPKRLGEQIVIVSPKGGT